MCDALIALADELNSVWEPMLRRGLLEEIPEEFSARLARLRVDGRVTAELLLETLSTTLEQRQRLREVLSQSEETMQALWNTHKAARQQGTHLRASAPIELDVVEGFASHSDLAPNELHLIPETSRTRTPDGVAEYETIPPHLEGYGPVERFEIRGLVGGVSDDNLVERFASALLEKMRGRNGVSQLNSDFRFGPDGVVARPWGTVCIDVPGGVTLNRAVIDGVNARLLGTGAGNQFRNFPQLVRYLARQGETWFSVRVPIGADGLVVTAH